MNYENKKSEDTLYNLRVLPKDIMVKEFELLESVRGVEELNLLLKLEEVRIYSEVENEVDGEGKRVYSNKEKRDFETRNRLDKLPSIVVVKEKIVDDKKSLDVGRVELDFMKRVFRASEVIQSGR